MGILPPTGAAGASSWAGLSFSLRGLRCTGGLGRSGDGFAKADTDAATVLRNEINAGLFEGALNRFDRAFFENSTPFKSGQRIERNLAAAASSRTPQPRAARAIWHCTGKKTTDRAVE
jgi:hypothetical protein